MLESGHTVLDCQIVKQLSENDVYQSYLVNCPNATAAKLFLLRPDPLFDQKQRQAFFDQVGWLSSQTFPCVGAPLRAGEVDGQPACLYPLPQGESLEPACCERFSVRQAVELVKGIAECLTVPHSAGLCHGNLSLETIYVDGRSLYLADFSLGQLIRLDYQTGINPLYTSPEQVRGESPTMASDIYSLGCVFYYLLTGQPPFLGDDAFAIAKQHLQGDFPRLPEELSILQPLLDSLTKTVAAERSTIDQLIAQIVPLSVHQEIDQIFLSAQTENPQPEDSSADENLSLLDDTLDNSEIAARIEARLKEHAGDFLEPVPVEISAEGGGVAIEQAKVGREGKPNFARFVLILFLGVLIGSGLYFLFYKPSPAGLPVAVAPGASPDDRLTADLDRGLQLWREADLNGAEAEFKRIVAKYQKDPRAYNNLAAFYAAQGNYEQARDYLEQALATDENFATVYHNLGSVYAEMARGSYGRALQLDKTQAHISLPVFSSLGVVNMEPVTADMAAAPGSELRKTTKPADKPGGATTTASSTDSNNLPSPAVERQEPLTVAAVEENNRTEKVEPTPAPLVVAAVEPLDAGESDNAVVVVGQQEPAEKFLQRWAQAWSEQDIDGYLTFYADQFIPPAGLSRSDWEEQRRSRLASPKELVVSLDNLQVTSQDDGRLQVVAIQSYRSDRFADRTRKIFDLQPTENSWKILRERSLGVIR